MAGKQARPPPIESLFSLRVANIDRDVSSDAVVDLFQPFGEIGHHYRPINMGTKQLSPFMFIRFVRKDSADRAVEALNGHPLGENGVKITVTWAKQHSLFTQDTGFITNIELDTKKVVFDEFDSSMPDDHYSKKRAEAVKGVDVVFTVRVDDLPTDFSDEELWKIFGQFGEISSIYHPYDLRNRKYKSFAFVRFLRQSDADYAVQMTNDSSIGKGRHILTQLVQGKSYFSQDETHYSV